ncbi:unnamed protein product [Sphagnum troendelagicum]
MTIEQESSGREDSSSVTMVRSSPAQQLCFLFLQSWFPVGLPPPASLQLETHFGGSIWCGKSKLLKVTSVYEKGMCKEPLRLYLLISVIEGKLCQLCGMWLQAPARYHCQSFPNQI